MSKEYIFRYAGSKEAFLNKLALFPHCHHEIYYVDDYMIEVLDDEIRFGIERTGHSGGNWFVAVLNENSGQTEFRGTIQYIGPENDRTRCQRVLDKLEEIALYIILFPMVAIFFAVSWVIRKVRRQPKPMNTEERLMHLMETHMGCQMVRVQ